MLEPVLDNEVPEIVSLLNRAYRAPGRFSEGDYISGTRTTLDLLQADVLAVRPHGDLLQWKKDGQRLGCVFLKPLDANTHDWYIGSVTTEPALQGGGLGKKLLGMAEQWAQERGAKSLRMTVVHCRTDLIAWYERNGFKPTGQTEPFPYGDERYGTPLRDDLHFVVLRKDLP